MDDFIKIRGARQNNLKNLDINIPKNKLVVVTGVSGSGKSSLVFDTIYAEGQRRYVESLSAYARQFLGVMDKPDVDSIEGLNPAISIDQKSVSKNPRSTVGTVTEIYDFLRLLFARVGHPHCPVCGREISRQTPQQIAETVIESENLPAGKAGLKVESKRGIRILVLAPVVRDRKGEFSQLLENIKRQGFSKVRVDGHVRDIREDFGLIRTNKHNIDVVIDRLIINKPQINSSSKPSKVSPKSPEPKTRLIQSIEASFRISDGNVIISEVLDKTFELPEFPKKLSDHLYSEKYTCPVDNVSLPEIEPRSFSFNSPHGACPKCTGLGFELKVDPQIVINPELSISEGGVLPWTRLLEHDSWFSRLLQEVAERMNINLNRPLKELSKESLNVLLFGTERNFTVSGRNRFGQLRSFEQSFEGVIPNLERRYRETESEFVRFEIEKFMVRRPCPQCLGTRLKKEALSVTIDEKNISEVTGFSIKELYNWVLSVPLSVREQEIAAAIFKEIKTRLKFLIDVGLDYLTISRESGSLAGGEAQRIRLASQIGSGLSGVIYCLDEPSIGLHPKDQSKLIETLKELRDLGNTVLVVEHDSQTMKEADFLIDIGPGAGEHGGRLISQGTPEEVMKDSKSLTGQYLSGHRKIELSIKNQELREKSSARDSKFLIHDSGNIVLHNCREHNLKNISVKIPLKKMVGVTGVSGSGKSTLVMDTLYRSLRRHLGLKEQEKPGLYEFDEGFDQIDKVIAIDQSPIGRTPRSNPATYIKVFDEIRRLFAKTPDARLKGFEPGRFSFNVPAKGGRGGRCEACQGDGEIKIEMQFLPDVYVKCDVCQGKRYNDETLEVSYNGKNIAEVLDMTVEQALNFFEPIPQINKGLATLWEVGLGYIKLGQSATTLSGGEAQRVKLAAELSKRATGKTLYILDEPTTGLHFADLEKLIRILKKIVARGNSVVVIEHNLDVIKNCDYLIDLGPEGGDEGGQIIGEGTAEQLIAIRQSRTGQELKKYK
ncbi:MAG: excinuclease ABC subunit UvrA [Patescibacteria group bacterium]|nr:excinuclease ABC subunit UvrA [Patescibacteria group bacterium]